MVFTSLTSSVDGLALAVLGLGSSVIVLVFVYFGVFDSYVVSLIKSENIFALSKLSQLINVVNITQIHST